MPQLIPALHVGEARRPETRPGARGSAATREAEGRAWRPALSFVPGTEGAFPNCWPGSQACAVLRVQRLQGHPRSGSSSPREHRGALATRLLRSCWADASPTSQGAGTALQAASLLLPEPSSFRIPAPLIPPAPTPSMLLSQPCTCSWNRLLSAEPPGLSIISPLKRLHTKGAVGAARPRGHPRAPSLG